MADDGTWRYWARQADPIVAGSVEYSLGSLGFGFVQRFPFRMKIRVHYRICEFDPNNEMVKFSIWIQKVLIKIANVISLIHKIKMPVSDDHVVASPL